MLNFPGTDHGKQIAVGPTAPVRYFVSFDLHVFSEAALVCKGWHRGLTFCVWPAGRQLNHSGRSKSGPPAIGTHDGTSYYYMSGLLLLYQIKMMALK